MSHKVLPSLIFHVWKSQICLWKKVKIVHIKLNKLYANHKLKLYVLKIQYLLIKIKNIVQGHTNIKLDLFFHWRVCFCLRSIVVKLWCILRKNSRLFYFDWLGKKEQVRVMYDYYKLVNSHCCVRGLPPV